MAEETMPEPTTEHLQEQNLRNFFTWQLTDPFKVERYLWGLSFANCTAQFEQEFYGSANANYDLPTVQESDDLKVSAVMCCSLCGAEFQSRDDQVQHYKGDWHRYNLKQKLRGRLPLTEEAFLDTIDEISSISGSESETGTDSMTEAGSSGTDAPSSRRDPNKSAGPQRSPKKASRERSSSVTSTDTEGEETDQERLDGKKSRMSLKLYLKNGNGQVLALYRCIVHGKTEIPLNHKELIEAVSEIPRNMHWAIIMVGGGHFAAAICDRGTVVVHKTFHRYTVRAKQGGAQSSRDGKQKGSQPKSAGASLRRHNEAALVKDIQDLLMSWNEELQKCSAIFYRAPGASRASLFTGRAAAFKKSDPRLRPIPFPTKRATHSEVLRVHKLLATVECFGREANIEGQIPVSPKVHSGSKKLPRSPKKQDLNQKDDKEVGNTVAEPLCITEKMSTNDNEGALSESEPEPVFELSEEPISTLGLREFASTRRRPISRHKKGKGSSGRALSEPSMPKEYLALRTAMFEACKSGNLDALSSLLRALTEKNNGAVDGNAFHARDNVPDSHASETSSQTDSCSKVDSRTQTASDKSHIDSLAKGLAGIRLETTDRERESILTYGFRDDLPTPQNEHGGKELAEICVAENESNCTVRLALETSLPARRLLSPTGSDPEATPIVEKVVEWCHGTDKLSFPDGPPSLDTCCEVVCKEGLQLKLLDAALDDPGTTLLHYCAKHCFGKLVKCLMEAGADPTVKNVKGQTAYAVTSDRQTRHEFRRFRAAYPERYDYNKTQIPSGLTEEMEKERNLKHAEKQKEKRKLHREKLKERKAAELQRQQEESERQRFLSLSDREKRALAAERRFAQQLLATNAPHVVLSRCFMCAADITGKVPFEYNDSKFCSIDCVKLHRQKPSGTRQ